MEGKTRERKKEKTTRRDTREGKKMIGNRWDKRTVRDEEEDAGGDASVHGALEEFRFIEEQIEMARWIKFGILEAVEVVDVLVENAQCQDRQGRVE